MTLTVAVYVEKGGTGKTTVTAHLSRALADQGLEVLAVDLAGKQGDLGKHFGVWADVRAQIEAGEDWPNIATMFADEWPQVRALDEVDLEDMILTTEEGVDVLPAHPGLDGLDEDLGRIDDRDDRYSRLAGVIEEDLAPRYDAILLDLPGAANNVSLSGLWAAGQVVAPVEMGPFETEQLLTLEEDLAQIAASWPVGVELGLVIPNKVDTRTRLGEEYLERLREEYGDRVADPPVPASQDLRNAADRGMTAYALASPSGTAQRALEAFNAAAGRLLEAEGVVPA